MTGAPTPMPCVIYLHGNASSRVQARTCLRQVLAAGITVFAFDASGCGMSEGEFISLGWHERDDLAQVVEQLRESGTTTTIGLWGMSMGAVTALLHGDRDPSIAAMVLDSPFSSLEGLAREMARNSGTSVPGFVLGAAVKMIRSTVQKKAKFDIKKLRPIDHVDQCFIPALFIAARDDTMVGPHHGSVCGVRCVACGLWFVEWYVCGVVRGRRYWGGGERM